MMYFSEKPIMASEIGEVIQTPTFGTENGTEPKSDTFKPFSFECEVTIKKKDKKKLDKLVRGKKWRLPRKLKKAMNNIGHVLRYKGEWIVIFPDLPYVFVPKTKWERKADNLAREAICEYFSSEHYRKFLMRRCGKRENSINYD